MAVILVLGVWLAWSLLPGAAARWVFATLETDWGVIGRVGQVDLNPFTLQIRVRNLSLAAASTADVPFFTAEAVTLDLPWSAVFDTPAIDLVDVVGSVVSVRRTADGVSNLPARPPGAPRSSGPAEPVRPVRLGTLALHRASISWIDDVRALAVTAAPVELLLRPDGDGGARTAGPLRLAGPTRVVWGSKDTSLEPLTAQVTLAGSALEVRDLVVSVPQGRLALDGDVELGGSDPTVGVDYRLDLDLARAATWLEGGAALRGTVSVAGRLDGPLAAPGVSARLESERIGWDELEGRGLRVTGRLAGDRVTIDQFQAGFAGGAVEGTGGVTLTDAGTQGDVRLSWTDLDADLLSKAAWPTRPWAVPSRLTGTVDASWTGPDPGDWVVRLESRHRAPPGAAVPGLPMEGQWRLDTAAGAWQATIDRLSAGAVTLTGALAGAVPSVVSEIGSAPVDGVLDMSVSDLRQLGADLEAIGLTAALDDAGLSGRASVALVLSGAAAAPRLTGELVASGLALGGDDEMELRATLSTTAESWRLDPVQLRVAGSAADGAVALHRGTGEIDGDLRLHIADLAVLDAVLPDGWHPGGALELDGSLSGRWSAPVLDARWDASDVVVAGQRLSSVAGQVRVGRDEVVVDSMVVRQERGRLEATARLTPSTGRYALSMTGLGMRLAPWSVGNADPLPLAATVDLDVDLAGGGPADDGRGGGRIVTRDLTYGEYTVDSMEHTLAFDQGEWLARSVIPGLGVVADLALEPEPPWRYRLEARLAETDLARLVRTAAGPADRVEGVINLSLAAGGTLAELGASDVTVDLDRFVARVSGTPVELAAPVRVRSSPDGVRVDGTVDLGVGDTRFTIDGAFGPGGGEALTASLTGDLGDLVALRGAPAPAPGETARLDLAGPFRVDARLTGSVDQPALTASLALDAAAVGVAGVPPVTDLTVRAAYDAAGLTLDELRGRWQGARLSARGLIPASVLAPYLAARPVEGTQEEAPARFNAVVEALQPDALAGFVVPETLEELSGEIGLELALEADHLERSAVRGAFTLTKLDLVVAGLPVTQQRPTRLGLADQRLTVESLAWQFGAAQNALTLGGHVDLASEPTADLTITGVADLSVFNAFSGAAAAAGGAYLVANVRGTLAAPSIDGVVEINDGEVRVPEPRLLVSDLSGALVFQGTTMHTVDLAGTANGGRVQLDGEIRFPGLRPEGSVALTGTAIAMVLPPGVRTELDADLRLTVAPEDGELSGTVTMLRGDYRERVNTAGGLRALMESRSDADLLETEPSFVDRMRLNVRVRTEDAIVVNNNYGAGTLTADTRLVGTVGRPGVTGRATVGDGSQIFLGGNVFEIETGAIDFVDPDGITPELDVTARTRVAAEEITITLAGTADTLTTEMRSSSDLPESDIVSLLLTGRTLDQVGSAPGAVARDQALGLVSGEVLGVAGRSVGLDTVRLDRGTSQSDVWFDASLVAGETNPGTRLTVGKNLSRQVQLVASQSLRDSGLITWIVNYLPRRNVEVRLVVDDETDRSYEFRHALSFGGGPDRATSATSRVEPRVSAVRFSGAASVPESELLRLARLRAGDRFDFVRWQDGRGRVEQALWDRGFQEARVRARRDFDTAVSTVALEFDVVAGPHSVLVVSGYEPTDGLRRAMEAAWRASVFDAFLREELVQLTRRYLVEEGFLRPVVSVEIDAADAGEKRITVAVETGPRSGDRRIQFVGQARLETARRTALVTPDRAADAWAGGEMLVQAVVADYRSQGMLDATATPRAPVFEGDAAMLTVAIVEGPVFRVSEVVVEGSASWTAERVRAVAGVTPGAVYRPGLADGARAAILVAYRREGFNAVRVRVGTSVDSAGAGVSLRVLVEEGRRQLLRAVEVEGATHTDPDVVERALRLAPGQPVDPAGWNQARKRLYDTGVFRSVDITPVPGTGRSAASDGLDELVVARVTLEEWPRYQLRYGLQVIDEQAPAGEVRDRGQIGVVADLTRQNLFGRAVTLGGAVRFDTVQQAGRVFMGFPSFLGRQVTSTLFVSRLRKTFGADAARVISERDRLTLEQQITPREGLKVSYSYNFERDHTFDENFDPSDPFAFDLTIDVARLNTSLVAEHRNDLFDATGGWFHASTIEWGVAALGSDLRFLKYLGQQYFFRSLPRGVVLASAARVGLGAGFGQELIPSERFFAGGGNTVRGYGQDGLGPVGFFGDPAGGSASVVLNQEVRFPLWRMFCGAGFIDAGNVFASVADVSLRGLQVGTGLGLRADTPVGLLRVDYGVPLSRADGDPLARWFFSIGQAF